MRAGAGEMVVSSVVMDVVAVKGVEGQLNEIRR
jgi:hypothetical protein